MCHSLLYTCTATQQNILQGSQSESMNWFEGFVFLGIPGWRDLLWGKCLAQEHNTVHDGQDLTLDLSIGLPSTH